MKKAVNPRRPLDQPLLDTTPYGYGKYDSVSDTTEKAAITHKEITLNGKTIPYTARAGHLVTADLYSAQPAAKIFYVSFTANGADPSKRPVTFFYNGGPGSSSVFLLLGSFGPRRIRTNGTDYTPPAPYALVDNEDCLLDHTDLVFINPVGTAYSTAIAPRKNIDFWSVDEDANSIKQFVKRYLTVFNRWNSPKFLFGESYGTARTCVLTWLLHEDGVDLNGIVLQSSILDYSGLTDAVGVLPTLAADAWYFADACDGKRKRRPTHLPTSLMNEVEEFACGPYAKAKESFPNVDPAVLRKLSDFLGGIPSDVLMSWRLDPGPSGQLFRTNLIAGYILGAYDGRVTAPHTGIAESIPGNDPAQMAVEGVYTAMWHVYLNNELKFTSTTPFLALNDKAGAPYWNFSHKDPTGKSVDNVYTAGDLAGAMELNPYLRVFSAGGYYDALTPYFETFRKLQDMPFGSEWARDIALDNLKFCQYESGHMIYLDDDARSEMKKDLATFYEDATKRKDAKKRPQGPLRIRPSTVLRRTSRTRY
jgi:carboxypeptidase C (cathepsin A)